MRMETVTTSEAVALVFEFAAVVDKREVDIMAQRVEEALSQDLPVRLLLDFRAAQRVDPRALMSPKGAMTSLRSIGLVERYIIVGAPEIAEQAVRTFGAVLPLKAMTFGRHDMDKARTALLETASQGAARSDDAVSEKRQ